MELRKHFFFEKKKQKTFDWLSRTEPEAYAMGKSFLLLFFKKEVLSFYSTVTDFAKFRG